MKQPDSQAKLDTEDRRLKRGQLVLLGKQVDGAEMLLRVARRDARKKRAREQNINSLIARYLAEYAEADSEADYVAKMKRLTANLEEARLDALSARIEAERHEHALENAKLRLETRLSQQFPPPPPERPMARPADALAGEQTDAPTRPEGGAS